jgi:hypothetical protein
VVAYVNYSWLQCHRDGSFYIGPEREIS